MQARVPMVYLFHTGICASFTLVFLTFGLALGLDCGLFQLQCTVFDGFSGEVALTAGGGRRGIPLFKDAFEDVALVSPVTIISLLL